MDIQESTMTTAVTYSNDSGIRYLITKKWDENLPKATIIMLMPGSSGIVQQDVTIACIINCTLQLGFESIDIVTSEDGMPSLTYHVRDNSDTIQ